MKKIILSAVTISIAIGIGLSIYSTSEQIIIPFNRSVELDDTYTIIWNGISKAYRYENEQWVRSESYDYQFDVIQKRYKNQWKSIKSLHRIHPDYDGKAGDRDQAMYFEVVYKNLEDEKVQSVINASLGKGTGISDPEFRNSKLTMYVENPSVFMPYNKFRISQHYNYEEGVLTETIELIKEKDGKETPFMKNEESAFIFVKGKLDKAPTAFEQ